MITKLENKYGLGDSLFNFSEKIACSRAKLGVRKIQLLKCNYPFQEIGLEYNLAWAYVYIEEMDIDNREPGIAKQGTFLRD